MSGRLFRGIRDPKLVLITGAGAGIGRATAIRFAARGARVVVLDIDKAGADETVSKILGAGGVAEAHRLDVTDQDAWNLLAQNVFEHHGVPDVLINNAGIGVIAPFFRTTEQQWDRLMAVNVAGVTNGCRAVAPLMMTEQHGQIVNVASGAAFLPTPLFSAYATSKAQVRMFSECMRGELAPHGVGVSVVCPGGSATGIFGTANLSFDDANAEKIERMQAVADTLIQRYGSWIASPDGIAKGIVRAVTYNLGLVPVRPDAWFAELAGRFAPELVRVGSAQMGPKRVEALVRITGRLVPEQAIVAAESFAANAVR